MLSYRYTECIYKILPDNIFLFHQNIQSCCTTLTLMICLIITMLVLSRWMFDLQTMLSGFKSLPKTYIFSKVFKGYFLAFFCLYIFFNCNYLKALYFCACKLLFEPHFEKCCINKVLLADCLQWIPNFPRWCSASIIRKLHLFPAPQIFFIYYQI